MQFAPCEEEGEEKEEDEEENMNKYIVLNNTCYISRGI